MNNISMVDITEFERRAAKKIPEGIRKKIIDEEIIDRACNIGEPGTKMEYLFDVYEEFIDIAGENDDFTCWRCRDKVLQFFRKIKTCLTELT